MNYDCYPLLMDTMERKISKELWPTVGIKVAKHERSHAGALRWLYEQNPDLSHSLDSIVMADEYHWLESEKLVVFPENTAILDRLLDAEVNLKNSAPIVMPHSCFILAMPKGYTYKGVGIPSVLIMWNDSQERDEIIENYTTDIVGRRMTRRVAEPKYEHEMQLYLSWRYEDADLPPELQGQLASFRFCVPSSMIPGLLRCETPTEMSEYLGKLDYADAFATNDLDNLRQFYVAKLVLMMGLYSHSFEDALKQGYPGKEPKHLEPRLHGDWNKTSLRMAAASPKHNEERNYHYRSWHFRQLMDERFYKGEYAHMPVGSRVVFVKDSMVGRKIEAETLSESKY